MMRVTVHTKDHTEIQVRDVSAPGGDNFASLSVGEVSILIFDSATATRLVHAALDAISILRVIEAKDEMEGQRNDLPPRKAEP
tara:strand:+ start:507 stop:755 length:249 start_codon:yes stop_codon:yes gene_type:complete